MTADPKMTDLASRAFAMFDAKIAAEKARKEALGEVRPIIHVEAWGQRLVTVGNEIWAMDPRATFADFLREHLRGTLGADWWKEESAKAFLARHPVAQWQQHLDEQLQAAADENGRVGVDTDGTISALLNLAYNLYIVQDNIGFHARAVERLRRRDHFAGVRHELLVGAAFVRAGFELCLKMNRTRRGHTLNSSPRTARRGSRLLSRPRRGTGERRTGIRKGQGSMSSCPCRGAGDGRQAVCVVRRCRDAA